MEQLTSGVPRSIYDSIPSCRAVLHDDRESMKWTGENEAVLGQDLGSRHRGVSSWKVGQPCDAKVVMMGHVRHGEVSFHAREFFEEETLWPTKQNVAIPWCYPGEPPAGTSCKSPRNFRDWPTTSPSPHGLHQEFPLGLRRLLASQGVPL